MVNKLELFLAVFFRGNDPDFLLLLILFFLELEVEVEKFEGALQGGHRDCFWDFFHDEIRSKSDHVRQSFPKFFETSFPYENETKISEY